MKTITLKVEDSIVDKLLILLQQFKSKEVEILDLTTHKSDNEFIKTRDYFHKCLDDIENNRVELVDLYDGIDELDRFIDSVK